MFGREPVAVAAFIRLALIAAVSFGLEMSENQMLSLMAAIEAGLLLLTRPQTTSKTLVKQRQATGRDAWSGKPLPPKPRGFTDGVDR